MISTKNVIRRFLSLLLAALMVISILPALPMSEVKAASSGTLTGLTDTSIGALWTASTSDVSYASWSVQSGTEILGTSAYESGTCSGNDNNTTLTLTNNKTETAVLSFTYTLTSSGTVQVDGTTVTTGSTFSKELAAGESVKIYVASNGSGTSAKITMSNITLLVNKDVTTTFAPAENGSYTVDGKTVTETYTNTQSSLTKYSVKSTPNDGYKFVGWYSKTDESYLKTDATTTFNFDEDKTITAVFTESDNQVYAVGTKMFYDLDEATKYAVDNSIEKVTLVQNGKSITGTHTIPSGVTLLIPFDSAATLYKEVPVSTQGGSTSNKNNAYRTLTLAEGAVLNIEGGLSVGGTYRACAGSSSGYMTGNYGLLNLSDGSSINVKNGGSLYAWGFVVGDGSVTAESGGTVWEWFQIDDFRGGTATIGMGNKVFPFSQYFIQNIETPLTIQAGAKENVYTGVYASSKVNNASIEFIGDGGMFKLNSGSITRTYDGSTDRVTYTVSGDMELNSLSLNLAGSNVDSASYVLPITNNISINVASGKATINQDLSLLAGVELTVAKGAVVTVASGKSVYVYDADEWTAANYVVNGQFKSVPFAYSRTRTRSNSDLVDAKIDVNGTLTAAGYIYTTAGGANICSSGARGKYVQSGTPGTSTETYQYTQSGSSVSKATISITAAKLRNADDSYVETSAATAGDSYTYRTNKWVKAGDSYNVTITYDANGGTGTMDAQTVTGGEAAALTTNAFTREGYTFSGWNTAADGTGTAYADSASVTLDEDTTLYAQWTANTYTVTWVDENGTELEKDEGVAYGTTPEYNGETPTKEGDAQYSYTFSGWTPEVSAVTGDVTYKATFTQTTKQYKITWKNGDEVLKETAVNYGETPSYDGTTPTKAPTAQYTYTFKGWTPEITTVTGNATYTAEFDQTVNTYTVTWLDSNGTTILEKDENVAYGSKPSFNGTTPTKAEDKQYSYTFKGWSPEITDDTTVTADVTYTAVYESTAKTYTVTWKNADGTVLETDEAVAYGTMPSYDGATPTKAADDDYTYSFNGWDPAISAVTGNVTYTATYTSAAIVKHTVTFDANGGEGSMDKQTFVQGVDTKLTANAFTRENYKFTGWNTAADGSGTSYADEGAIIDLKENITLYAQWSFQNGWLTDDVGTTYYRDGEIAYKSAWATIDEKAYYFDEKGYIVKGVYQAPYPDSSIGTYGPNENDLKNHEEEYKAAGYETKSYFLFDGNGVFQKDYTGTYTMSDGTVRWVAAGELSWHGCLVTDGTDYYYVSAGGSLHQEGVSWINDTNDLLDKGYYYFKDYKIQKDTTGFVSSNGSKYYLVNGRADTQKGLIKVDGSYYYVKSNYTIVCGSTYYVSNTNDLMPAGTYTFDLDGKMVIETPSTKNGLVEENGDLYYYVDGVKTHAGLIQIDGAYYYINSACKAVRDCNYYVSNTNGLMSKGTYHFGADGKMVIPDAKNGLIEENGELYYYVDGVKTHAGLIQIDGAYYYINSSGKAVKNCDYYVSNTNDLMAKGTYHFGTDGKLEISTPKDGLVEENGDLYYYVDGVRTHAGLILVDGYYYYINSSCKAVKDCNYYISNTNGLMAKGTYHFGADGKLVLNE